MHVSDTSHLPPASAAIDEDVKTLSKVEQLGGVLMRVMAFLKLTFINGSHWMNGLAHLASLEKNGSI